MSQKIYPRSNDKETIYLKSVITNPNIIVIKGILLSETMSGLAMKQSF